MSLSRHLLLWSLISGPLVVALFGILAYGVMRDRLICQFDESLQAQLRTLALAVEQDRARLNVKFENYELLSIHSDGPPEDAIFIQIQSDSDNDRSLYRSSSLNGASLSDFAHGSELDTPRWCPLPGGRGRVVGMRFVPEVVRSEEAHHERRHEGGIERHANSERPERREHESGEHARTHLPPEPEPLAIVLLTAQRTDEIDSTLSDLRRMMIVAGIFAAGLSFVGSIVGIRRGLLSVRKVSRAIKEIGPTDLSARIPDHVPSELAPMVHQINTLLERLDKAFDRERKFSSDVAHELRTPIAGLQMKLDVTLLAGDDPDEVRREVTGCKDIADGLQQVVTDLLAITRLDAGRQEAERQSVDLFKECLKAWQPLQEEVEQKCISVKWQVPKEMIALADPSLFRVILRNLFGNAAEYVDRNGLIRVVAERTKTTFSILIENSGCVLSQDDVSNVTTRFWRGDNSRGETGRHAGLGLSLVESATKALGGRLKIHLHSGNVFSVEVRLPSEHLTSL